MKNAYTAANPNVSTAVSGSTLRVVKEPKSEKSSKSSKSEKSSKSGKSESEKSEKSDKGKKEKSDKSDKSDKKSKKEKKSKGKGKKMWSERVLKQSKYWALMTSATTKLLILPKGTLESHGESLEVDQLQE